MQQFNINKGVKGSRLIQERALRFAYMIQDIAKRRARALIFYEKYGLNATLEAFNISRSTLYRWQSKLKAGKGKLEALNNQSRTPQTKRKRRLDHRIETYIIEQREKYPRLGKKKLTPLLKAKCLEWSIEPPSEPTVGRVIKDLKDRGRLPNHTKLSLRKGVHYERKIPKKTRKQRRKGYRAANPGALVEIDTVVLFVGNIRRYIITAVDVYGRFAYAKVYKSPSSANAKDFFKELRAVAPFMISHIQTDNGSEFEKHFRQYVEKLGIVHFNTYPRCPKQNAHIERFNRTIQEEFVYWHKHLLLVDMEPFQKKLTEWLLWYNTERPHEALGLVPPMWYITRQLIDESHLG